MNKKDTSVIIDGKPISIENWFTTLEKNPNGNYTVPIEVLGYSELGFILSSILAVCNQATQNSNNFLSELDLSRMFEIAQNLIPHAELELLDKLKPF